MLGVKCIEEEERVLDLAISRKYIEMFLAHLHYRISITCRSVKVDFREVIQGTKICLFSCIDSASQMNLLNSVRLLFGFPVNSRKMVHL